MSNLVQWIIVGLAVLAALLYLQRKIKRSGKGECGGCCSGCKLEKDGLCSGFKDLNEENR